MKSSIKNQFKIILTVLIILQINNVFAQYYVETFPKSMTSILSHPDTVTLITATTANTETTVSLPFSFTYFNQIHDSIDVNSNGFIAFTPLTGTEFDYFNQPLPHVHKPDGIAALFWDDLSVYGSISYLIEGTAPNRKIIIEYSSLGDLAGNTNILTGQIHLYETSNFIEFHYQTDASPVIFPTATIGLENQDATIGIGGPNTDSNNNIPDVNYRFKPFSYSISGHVYGLVDGNNLVLQNSNGDSLSVNSIGEFTMPLKMHEGAAYSISIANSPVNQSCTAYYASGTVTTTNITNIGIYCSAQKNSGNSSYKYNHLLNSFPYTNFTLDGEDYLNSDWWFYRIQGDTQEKSLPHPDKIEYHSYGLILSWFDLDNRGKIKLIMIIDIFQDNSLGAHLNQEVYIENLTNEEIDIHVFKYFDFDIYDVLNNEATLESEPDYIKVFGGDGQNIDFAEMRAGGNIAYQVQEQPTIRQIFSNTQVDDLDNSGLPFGPGDFAAAFQWNSTIPPNNGYIVLSTSAAIGDATATEPQDIRVFGLPRNINVNVDKLAPGNSIVIQNNGTDELSIDSNGNYSFSMPIMDGDSYSVTISQQLTNNNQQCNFISGQQGAVIGFDIELEIMCSFIPFNITDGTAEFKYYSPLDFGNTGFYLQDFLINYARWYYRTETDMKELKFPIPDTSTYNGNSVTIDWFNLDDRNLFSAQLIQTIEQNTSTGAIVVNALTINNLSNEDTLINLFNYADFDIDDINENEAVLLNPNNHIGVLNNSTQDPINVAEFRAGGETNYQISDFTINNGVRRLLEFNLEIDDLNNTGSPLGPTDIDMAFQWTHVIPAYGSLTVQSIYAAGSSNAPQPADPKIISAVIFKNGFEIQ